ncbi:MAG TPA: hypothetical protein VN457_00870, partial [Chlamydiales bacterium]|nr:hypothetical protein [Chlamydiales bacterium]
MYIAFREQHLLRLLDEYEQQTASLDYFVSLYFRAHKQLGSKDRAFINDTLYALIRWKGLYDALLGGNPTWEKRLQLFLEKKPELYLQDSALPLATRVSFPDVLFREISASWP